MNARNLAAEALAHVDEADLASRNGKWETARQETSAASIKATLALVEEQRTANLIAYANTVQAQLLAVEMGSSLFDFGGVTEASKAISPLQQLINQRLGFA